MEQSRHSNLEHQPEVVLSQPAKAISVIKEAPVSAAPRAQRRGKKARFSKHALLKGLCLLLTMLLVSLGSIHTYVALTGGSLESRAIAKVYQNALPSVVLITAESGMGETASSGTGSGVIVQLDQGVKAKSYIVTNAHVIEGATRVTIMLHSGEEVRATVEGIDENTDLALLSIPMSNLPAASFASDKAMRNLRAGDTAIVIGNPLGVELSESMTVGVISTVGRGVEVGSSIVEMLQTDAAVSPGNSGGPMFDVHGNIIGIITSKVIKNGAEGIGFAVPADLTKRIVGELAAYGKVMSRPMMGITIQVMDQATVDYYKETYGEIYQIGMIVKEINQGNNAWQAGLRVGDKILKFNGFDVTNANQVNYLKERLKIGDTVTLTVERGGQTMELSFRLEGPQ